MPKVEIDIKELKELVECAIHACTECGGMPTGTCEECAVGKWEKQLKEIEGGQPNG